MRRWQGRVQGLLKAGGIGYKRIAIEGRQPAGAPDQQRCPDQGRRPDPSRAGQRLHRRAEPGVDRAGLAAGDRRQPDVARPRPAGRRALPDGSRPEGRDRKAQRVPLLDEIRAVLRENQIRLRQRHSQPGGNPGAAQARRGPEPRAQPDRRAVRRSCCSPPMPAKPDALLATHTGRSDQEDHRRRDRAEHRPRCATASTRSAWPSRSSSARAATASSCSCRACRTPPRPSSILGATATLEYRGVVDGNATEARRLSGIVPPEARALLHARHRPGRQADPDPAVTSASSSPATSWSMRRRARPAERHADGQHRAEQARRHSACSTSPSENVGKRMAVVYIERIPDVKIVDGKEVRTSRVTEEVISAATIQGVFGKQFPDHRPREHAGSRRPGPAAARRCAGRADGYRRGAHHRPQPGRGKRRARPAGGDVSRSCSCWCSSWSTTRCSA